MDFWAPFDKRFFHRNSNSTFCFTLTLILKCAKWCCDLIASRNYSDTKFRSNLDCGQKSLVKRAPGLSYARDIEIKRNALESRLFLCKEISGWDLKYAVNTLKPRQMDAISQTPFSNGFSWMKVFEFRLNFHWGLFPRVQLTKFQHWFR